MMWLISKVVTQKCNSSRNLQRSNLVCAGFENVVLSETAIQTATLKKILPINFSCTLDDLHTLDKFSFTFRYSRSQIIFKIGVSKILQYSQENTCVGVSFL